MWSLFPGVGLKNVRKIISLGLPGQLGRSSPTRRSCHPHPYPNESMQLCQVAFKDSLCGASSPAITWDAGVLGNFDDRILRVVLDCFGAFVLSGFVPLGLVQAWMVSVDLCVVPCY